MKHIIKIKETIKKLFHRHKYTTLLIYPPHNQKCDLPQCKSNDRYGFLVRCYCGYTTLTKLSITIKEILEIKETK